MNTPTQSSHPGFASPADEEQEQRELEQYLASQNPVDLAASDWQTRQQEGLTPEEAAEFQQWLTASPAHAAAYDDMAQSFVQVQALPQEQTAHLRAQKTLRTQGLQGQHNSQTSTSTAVNTPPPPQTREQESPLHPRASHGLSWLTARWGWVAACLALVLCGHLGWQYWQAPQFSSVYATAQGQRQSVTLADGTEITLDSSTQADIALYRKRREVHLCDGQIMLKVSPDAARPFHVQAGAARITVLGTRFSVRHLSTGSQAGAVDVAVEEGSVSVQSVGASGKNGSGLATVLHVGQSLHINAHGAAAPITPVPSDSVALWRDGLVRFADTPLADALAELERYGPTNLVIDDAQVAGLRIGGTYETARPDRFARLLPQIFPVSLQQRTDGKTLIALAR